MRALSELCDTFRERIEQITKHSTDGAMSRRDNIRLHFEEKEGMTAFKYRLNSYKLTINIALGPVNLYVYRPQSRD
jgi:hypothetical protein